MPEPRNLLPLGPILVGLGGIVVLMALGLWQLDRLGWKEGLIETAEARMSAAPVALPAGPDPARDDYLPVAVSGRFLDGPVIRFLSSLKPYGPGHELIVPFETSDGRRILVDRGFVPLTADMQPPVPEGEVVLTGLLRWPDDVNLFTPAPDLDRLEWYSRDVASLAAVAETEAVLLVRQPDGGTDWPRARPPRVTLPNNHLQYALTWFGLALVWGGMSLLWLRRLRLARQTGSA